MYLTNRLDSKTLTLTLVSLVLTFTTCGIFFVTYFFYTQGSSLFTVKPIPVATLSENINKRPEARDFRGNTNTNQEHLDHQPSLVRTEHDYNQRQQNSREKHDRWSAHAEKVTGNNIKSRSYVLAKSKEGKQLDHFRHYDSKYGEDNGGSAQAEDSSPKQDQHGQEARSGNNERDDLQRRTDLNSETIYIDDYDRPSESARTNRGDQLPTVVTGSTPIPNAFGSISDQLDINNIDYFDSIIKDHSASGSDPPSTKLVTSPEPSSAEGMAQGEVSHHKEQPKGRRKSRKESPGRLSSSLFYYPTYSRSDVLPSFKTKLVTTGPTDSRRPYSWNRNGLVDDDDSFSSDELLDNDSIGSGSGDFIDEEDIEESAGDDSDEHRFLYANNRRVEYYRFSDEFLAGSPIYNNGNYKTVTAVNQSSRLGTPTSASVQTNNSRSSTNSGTKKWIPPSIVSSRESRLVTTAASTTSGPLHLTTVSYPPTNLNLKTSLPTVGNLQIENAGSDALATVNQQQQPKQQQQHDFHQNSGAWLETRARRIMGNVKKSEERSRQLLLCAEAGGGELCRMLFKGHLNE